MVRLGGYVWCAVVMMVVVVRQGRAIPPIPGQLYTSLAHMSHVFAFDRLLGDLLLLHLPEHLPETTQYLHTYKNVVVDRARGLDVKGNPLHVYEVIKRLVIYWPDIQPKLQLFKETDPRRKDSCEDTHPECENWSLLNECITTRDYMVLFCPRACNICPSHELKSKVMEVLTAASATVFPTSEDLYGAALALARLQRVYRIPITSLMAGYAAGVASSIRLSLDDCLRVANATHGQGDYSYALVWYDYCLVLAKDDPPSQTLINEKLNRVKVEHNTYWADTEFFFRYHLSLGNEINRQVPRESLFSQVCRGKQLVEIPEAWRLQCHINHRGSPYLLLQPIRYEQIHYDPELYLFYDVISDAEINVIKNLSKELLHQSGVVSEDLKISNVKLSMSRTSHTAWLANTTHPVLTRLALRVQEVAGLFTFEGQPEDMAGEMLQVLNYGIGGHYDAHMDPLFKELPPNELQKCYPVLNKDCDAIVYASGDRVATWMFYLSDVTAGGRTGFPLAGVSVPSVRGGAAFWYNLNPDGEANPRTRHGGCPVLMGEKWVANKWIREHANFQRRPCTPRH